MTVWKISRDSYPGRRGKQKNHRGTAAGVRSPSLFRDSQLRSAVSAVGVRLLFAAPAANRGVPKYFPTIPPEIFHVNEKFGLGYTGLINLIRRAGRPGPPRRLSRSSGTSGEIGPSRERAILRPPPPHHQTGRFCRKYTRPAENRGAYLSKATVDFTPLKLYSVKELERHLSRSKQP